MRTLQILHLLTATPCGPSATLTPSPSLTPSLHLIYFLSTPTGGGRWPPSRVQLCSRFLPMHCGGTRRKSSSLSLHAALGGSLGFSLTEQSASSRLWVRFSTFKLKVCIDVHIYIHIYNDIYVFHEY